MHITTGRVVQLIIARCLRLALIACPPPEKPAVPLPATVTIVNVGTADCGLCARALTAKPNNKTEMSTDVFIKRGISCKLTFCRRLRRLIPHPFRELLLVRPGGVGIDRGGGEIGVPKPFLRDGGQQHRQRRFRAAEQYGAFRLARKNLSQRSGSAIGA